MKMIFRYRKPIGLVMLISTFLLYLPPSPAQAVMINTQHTVHQDSEQLSARARVKAFLGKAERYKVGFQPGIKFSSMKGLRNHLRFSFAYYDADDLVEGIERLAQVL